MAPRCYMFKNRVPRNVSAVTKVTRWEQCIKGRSEEEWRNLSCCKKKRCFKSCNMSFLIEASTHLISSSTSQRREFLSSLLSSSGKFVFDGDLVCTIFLEKAFYFSRCFQSSVKNGRNLAVAPLLRPSPGKDSIICFLTQLAERTSERMPDCNEFHLPFHTKEEVYNLFCSDVVIQPTNPPTQSYFLSTWKCHCSNIKVRRVNRFSMCATCDELRNATIASFKAGSDTTMLLERRREHINLIAKERRQYQNRKESAMREPHKFCSIIIDGADQSSFGLPHFVSTTKDTRGHSIKVRLIGLLEHRTGNHVLSLYTMTEEHCTGANHVIESLHRFLNSRSDVKKFPSVLYIQVDNCTRENKNRFFFSYIESLVCWGLFDEVCVSFLPIGHTHEDIDQCFSCTSRRLRVNNAITRADLHEQLKKSYNSHTTVTSILNVANISGLLQSTDCIRSRPPFSHYRYFRFQRAGESISCHVRAHVNEQWCKFGGDGLGFLLHPPPLHNTPPTSIECPDGVADITKRILSEESRINCSHKIQQLYDLRDYVYRSRMEDFHWRSDCIEMNYCDRSNGDDTDDNEYINSASHVTNNYTYDRNCFVSVLTEDHNCPFWVGCINEVHKNNDDIVSSLSVHWYQASSSNIYEGTYSPAFISTKSIKRKPWIGTVSSDSVIICFPSLTCRKHLPAAVHKKLRSEFSGFVND